VDIRLHTEAKSISKDEERFTVRISSDSGEQTLETDLVVHGAGRVPDIDDLGCERAGIKRRKKGVSVNEYLQSVSNAAVYAAGDAADTTGMPLTPVANMEGNIAAGNMLKGNHRKPNYSGISTVVFTIPPLASVGLREEEARTQSLKFRVKYQETSDWYSSRRVGLKYSGFKVLVEEQSDRILGAHLFGHNAEETINIFALAIRHGIKAQDLRRMIYAYPTSASDIGHMI
jgi:glutathione reductase (NADPH)